MYTTSAKSFNLRFALPEVSFRQRDRVSQKAPQYALSSSVCWSLSTNQAWSSVSEQSRQVARGKVLTSSVGCCQPNTIFPDFRCVSQKDVRVSVEGIQAVPISVSRYIGGRTSKQTTLAQGDIEMSLAVDLANTGISFDRWYLQAPRHMLSARSGELRRLYLNSDQKGSVR